MKSNNSLGEHLEKFKPINFSKWSKENTPEQETVAAKWRRYYTDRFNNNYK